MSLRSQWPSPTQSEWSAASTPTQGCAWNSWAAKALDDAGDEPWCAQDRVEPRLPRSSPACVALFKGQSAPPCAITKSGMLSKEGYWRRNWKTRLFVLDAWGLRYYYNGCLKGHVPLSQITDARAVENEIRLVTPNREYKIVTAHPSDSAEWVAAISHNIRLLPRSPATDALVPRSFATWLNVKLVGEAPATKQPINAERDAQALAALRATMYV